jgi:uncharacterized protein (DUF305 family)
MPMLPFFGTLLLAIAMAAPQPPQAPKPGVIPEGLSDGPYVHMMAMHHEEGIRMASLGSTKATNPVVKALAARILAHEQKELAQLKQFMTTVAEDMVPANKGILKKMPVAKLEQASGTAFDSLFLDMMIEHHQDAIRMTKDARLVMTGVQEFARRLTDQLTADISEMQGLRKQIS